MARYLETGEWSSSVSGPRVIDAHPQSMHVAPLGLFLANEGKNRVALYQQLRLPMPSDVWISQYIAPERMALIETENGWSVQLDQGETRAVAYCADIVVPLLTAYGVPSLERSRTHENRVKSAFLHRILNMFS